jgi:hypothetical protein
VPDDAFYDIVIARAAPFSALPEPELSFEQEDALVAGEWVPPEPLVFRRNSDARRPDDLVFGGSPSVYLVSERFVRALRDGGATGWGTYPIRLLDEDGTPIGDHAGLVVTGSSGPIDPALSTTPPDRPRIRVGKLFRRETWDGSDVFVPREGGGLFVTQRARDALERGGVRGLLFEPLDRAEWVEGTF